MHQTYTVHRLSENGQFRESHLEGENYTEVMEDIRYDMVDRFLFTAMPAVKVGDVVADVERWNGPGKRRQLIVMTNDFEPLLKWMIV